MSIEVTNEAGVVVDEETLGRAARHALDLLGVSPDAELSVLLVEPERMAQLHLEWMDEPGPTDVMAFPMDELDLRSARRSGQELASPAGEGPTLLGDVVLCPVVAEAQAAAAGHSTAEELELLVTHGVLHLLGYDHMDPEEHAEMFGLQGELLTAWQRVRGA